MLNVSISPVSKNAGGVPLGVPDMLITSKTLLSSI